MKDFDLVKFVRNNQLLNEGVGGYVDMKSTKEELDTAMEEDTMTSDEGLQYEDEDDDAYTNDERIMGLGGDRLVMATQFLVDDGFEIDTILDFLRRNVR
jgi:hypothetical protein